MWPRPQVTEGHASLEVSPVGVAKAAGVALADLQGALLRLAVGVVESAGGRGFGGGGGARSLLASQRGFWDPKRVLEFCGGFGVPKGFSSLRLPGRFWGPSGIWIPKVGVRPRRGRGHMGGGSQEGAW